MRFAIGWIAVGAATAAYMMLISADPLMQITSCETFAAEFDCNQSLLSYFGYRFVFLVILPVALCLTAALRTDVHTACLVSAALVLTWAIGVGGTLLSRSPNIVNIYAYLLPTVVLALLLTVLQKRFAKPLGITRS